MSRVSRCDVIVMNAHSHSGSHPFFDLANVEAAVHGLHTESLLVKPLYFWKSLRFSNAFAVVFYTCDILFCGCGKMLSRLIMYVVNELWKDSSPRHFLRKIISTKGNRIFLWELEKTCNLLTQCEPPSQIKDDECSFKSGPIYNATLLKRIEHLPRCDRDTWGARSYINDTNIFA